MKFIDKFQRKIEQISLHSIALIIAYGLLSGCASVNPEPFTKYRNAVQEAQSGIDAAMSIDYAWTRTSYIENFSGNKESKFTMLMIQPGEKYDWSLENPPVYLSVKLTRSRLADLNQSFIKYADLLNKLASPNLISTETFDQLTKDLNKNATEAAKALGLDSSSDGIAIFSTAASEAARLYIENRRQEHLKNAIEENQKNVQKYAQHCVSLIHTIRGSIKNSYANRTEPIQKAWKKSIGKERQNNTEAMLNLNEQYADVMRVLQELESTYSALPEAHADLSKGIETTKLDIAGIEKLYSSAKRLQRLYNELKDSAEKKTNS